MFTSKLRLRHLLRVLPLLLVAESVAKSDLPYAYSFSNPAPQSALRELATDRPDVTESPFTLDPGHSQLEMDGAAYSYNHVGGVHTRSLTVADFNLRLGLTPNVEAGIFLSPYTRVTEQDRGGDKAKVSGFGDTVFRAKVNFWGNDGGDTAFGLIVDLSAPTGKAGLSSGKTELALILPASFALPGGWELGVMTQLEFLAKESGSGRDLGWLNTITVGHDLWGKLGGYAELTSHAGRGTHAMTVDLGLTYAAGQNTQLDFGVNLGVTRAADDALVFAGISRRF